MHGYEKGTQMKKYITCKCFFALLAKSVDILAWYPLALYCEPERDQHCFCFSLNIRYVTQNISFPISKRIFSGSKYPQTSWINSENWSTGDQKYLVKPAWICWIGGQMRCATQRSAAVLLSKFVFKIKLHIFGMFSSYKCVFKILINCFGCETTDTSTKTTTLVLPGLLRHVSSIGFV